MKMRPLAPVSVFAALLVSLVSTTASADEPSSMAAPVMAQPGVAQPPVLMMPMSPPPPDRARFRGGVALEGGALIVPGSFSVGVAGVQGQLGAQINNEFGVYVVPSLDVVFGSVGGLNFGFAVMVDYTLDDSLTFGVGPDVDAFAAIGGSSSGTMTGVGGALYGGRLHFGWSPALSQETNRARRKALTIGVDVRLLGGAAAFATASSSSTSAGGGTFVLSPMLTVGYNAF